MSGHSKWNNIKHRKGVADAKRGKQFTKLAKEIMISAKLGGSDMTSNPRLRTAVQKARDFNVPKENIEKAIKKGAGELEGVNYEEITYEAYGPHGIAYIIEVMTDKKTRTVPELKNIFSKLGGSLGETGSVGFLFDHMGIIILEAAGLKEDDLIELTLEIGAADFETNNENEFVIKTLKENFHAVMEELTPMAEKHGWKILHSELQYLPKTNIDLSADEVKSNLTLIDALESHDDVQNVYYNLSISDEALINE
ncbi:MAG: YebC/PmpR family DNA-binding transcriptional regulator [Spirochaetia bacterium]|nr:YebC/PmpR family DNA-binding transcriptional regulator [Spirochaetia bacterium]